MAVPLMLKFMERIFIGNHYSAGINGQHVMKFFPEFKNRKVNLIFRSQIVILAPDNQTRVTLTSVSRFFFLCRHNNITPKDKGLMNNEQGSDRD